ncbi:RidA family protein [Belnapia sp. T6]|uniref:RidA family protein n=1 Tax=Belnapia mucosa TaxID=2804532 RepID=A0ABS1V8D7_9PROT|nr:RidA family protein [Belnapia mucosa]MBL6457934.1 RidA family protein [Belnapia mucosa]
MADIQRFAPPKDGRPFPPLSVAVRHGNTLYVSGIGPFTPDGSLARGDFAAQFAEVIKSLHAILAEAGTEIGRVIKTNVLLTRAGDVAEMNRLYAAAFPAAALPARTTCVVAALPVPDFLLEIECVAALD